MIKRFLLLFMLFVSFFSQKALAISIVLDGTQELISGQECQTATYRFGTQSSYQGQPIDLILEVTAEDNEYNANKCVDIVDNVIGFRLRDKDFSNNYAYMDIKVTVVKKGTLTPLNVDAITVTNFDLDSNPYYTGTDDVYYKNPTKVYLSEFTNVTESRGSFFNNYTTKPKGQSSGNCDDSATLLQKECRGGVSFNNTSSFYARVQNDNAYGTYNSRYEAYRLIQFSFELKDLTPLMSDIELPCGISNYSTSNNSWIEGTTHNRYIDNMDISKTFKIENTQSIKLTINGETEKNFDWVYIYDENNNQVYVGSGIFNNTQITVTGSKVTVRVTSDRSVTKSGISVKIKGVGCEEEPTISIANPVEITEGDSGDKDLIFTINLDTPAPSNGVTVQVDPHNITALEGEDYSRVISSINFNQGELQKTIIYKIHGDTKVEDNETFSIELHNPQNAKLDENKSSAIGTIINDDKEIFVSIAGDANITEGDSGTQPLDFKILLSDPAPIGGVIVQVQPHNITALEGEDYSRNISSIYFAQGEKEKTISFSINGDTKVEDDEQFSIELLSPQNASLDENNKTAIGTIINDDEETPELIAEYRFDECPLDLTDEIDDHSPYRHRHRIRNGFTTKGDIAQINRSGEFHRDQQQYTEGEDGLDEIFGTSSNEFTITTWVYPTSLTTDKTNHNTENTFFAKASDTKNDNIEIGINSNGTLHLYLDTLAKDRYADFGEVGDITTNSWHFIGVSYKNGEVTVQIDDKTYTNNSTWSGATNLDQAVGSPVTIGASLHINNYFDGYIDEFKIFSNQITARTMNQFRERERNRRNWDDTVREEVVCTGASPVGCIMSAFMFQNKPTDINVLNLANGEMNLVKNNISDDNINALGFNKKDGYFWGYNYTKQNGTVTRIGMNSQGEWVSENFLIDGLSGFKSYVGDIDNNGHLYLKESGSSKRVVVIDLDPNSTNYLKKIRDFNLDFYLDTADWGFNPKDNLLYAVNNGSSNKYLYKIDPNTGHMLSRDNTLLIGYRGFGASFFDANGFYYVYDNSSGNIYRIDVAHSANAVLFANANIVSLNDGAMCTDAEFKFDFGDLPEDYPTLLESDGARHSLPTYGEPTVYMGLGVSNENNGKPSVNANLDTQDDGVTLDGSSLQDKIIDAGKTTTLKIITHGEGFLNAWIDWNSDGDFDDINEQIAKNIDGNSGLITLNITAPNSATDITTYARFRYSYQKDLTPTGSAIDGEVEDYKLNIHGNLEPFSCSDKLYLSNRTELGVGSGDSGATWLHSFYTMTPAFTPIGDGFTSSDGGYNAIGYNPKDNFIYALYGNRLLKIDKNANIKDLGVVNGLPDEQLYAGTFDREGYYFVSGNGNEDNKIYKINIENNTVTKVININLDGEDKSVKFWDMAIDTSDQYLYAMLVKDSGDDFTNDKFVKIDKNTGAISIIGEEYNDINSYISLIYTDSNNKIVAIANGGGMYEINPLTGTAYWINSTPELSYYNDGGNCPNASFILPPHIPRLSIGDVSKAEGDSGETNFEFKVSIDADLPMAPMGMPVFFFYKVIDGNGNDITPPHGVATQSDNDFRGGNGIGINMNIFSDKREATISVPVYGDTKVEPDEEFFVDIYFPQMFPQNFCLLGKSRGVGVILNDDIKFKIIRTNGDDSEDKLYTQITNRDFDYSIISNNDTIDDMTLKIELIDTNSNDILYRGYQYIQNSNRADIINNTIAKNLIQYHHES